MASGGFAPSRAQARPSRLCSLLLATCAPPCSPPLSSVLTLGSLTTASTFSWEFHQFLAQQCQDLISQTSSPLSQNDSCTGRSAELLLPSADTSRRRHDSPYDPGAASRVERFRVQVSGRVRTCRGQHQEAALQPTSPLPRASHLQIWGSPVAWSACLALQALARPHGQSHPLTHLGPQNFSVAESSLSSCPTNPAEPQPSSPCAPPPLFLDSGHS